MRSEPDFDRFRRPSDGSLPFTLKVGSGTDPVRLVCGFLACDARPFNPLLAALPPVIHMSDCGSAVAELVRFAVAESRQPRMGGECVLGKLSELMFVDVVRCYIESLPQERNDWLAGLRDPSVGRALAALHGSPARAWTIELLARESGLSRSALAERFTTFVGQPPIQYLAKLAHAARGDPPAERRRDRGGGRAGRLRLGSGLQPRVQEGRGRSAGPVAAASARRGLIPR